MFIKRISNGFIGALLRKNMKATIFKTDVTDAKIMVIFLNKFMIVLPERGINITLFVTFTRIYITQKSL